VAEIEQQLADVLKYCPNNKGGLKYKVSILGASPFSSYCRSFDEAEPVEPIQDNRKFFVDICY